MPSSQLTYRSDIDGLRGLAVLAVIVFHLSPESLPGGYWGVDIFFVLSGYLITRNISKSLHRNDFSLRQFWDRRIRRILPALLCVLVASTAMGWLVLTPLQYLDFSKSLIATLFSVSNFYFHAKSGYFDVAAHEKPLLHTWSLGVEEQFYFLFPIVMLWLWKSRKESQLQFFVMLLFLGFSFSLLSSWVSPKFAFYSPLARAWEFLVGAIVAFISSNPSRTNLFRWQRLGGLLLIFFSFWFLDATWSSPGVGALPSVLGTALILLRGSSGVGGALLSVPPLRAIGLLSYGAYLWHQPLFVLAVLWFGPDIHWMSKFGLTLLVFFCSAVTHRLIESPGREVEVGSKRWKRVYALIVMSVLGLLIFHGYSWVHKGFEQRYARSLEGDVGHDYFHALIDKRFKNCQPPAVYSSALVWDGYVRCKQSKEGPPDVVLLGDSHAEHFFIGVADSLPNQNVAFYIRSGFPALGNSAYREIFANLLSIDRPTKIILAVHYTGLSSAANESLYYSLSELIDGLMGRGHRVAMVLDTPVFVFLPEDCVYRVGVTSWNRCDLPKENFSSQRAPWIKQVERIASERSLAIVDPAFSLCGPLSCSMSREGVILFRDRNHLNTIGSDLLGRNLVDSILAQQPDFFLQ